MQLTYLEGSMNKIARNLFVLGFVVAATNAHSSSNSVSIDPPSSGAGATKAAADASKAPAPSAQLGSSNKSQDLSTFFGTPPCANGPGLEKFSTSLVKSRGGDYFFNKNYVVPAGIQLSAPPTLQSEGSYSVLTVPISGKWLGLTVKKYEKGMGHDNGISFSGVQFAENSAVVADVLRKHKMKLVADRERKNVFVLQGDDFGEVAISPVASGGSALSCDWSN